MDSHQPHLPCDTPRADDGAQGSRWGGGFLAGGLTYTAVVLAGSRPGRDALAEQFGTDLKALIPVRGEPMVVRPVRALLEAAKVGKILVLAQDPERIAPVLPSSPKILLRPSQQSIAETMMTLVRDTTIAWPLLVTTADHALLKASIVDEFLDGAAGADVAVGVVRRGPLMRRLPATKRTWLKFRKGAYTGANLFALGSPSVGPAIALWRSVEQDRKKAWRVISALGPLVLLSAALRLISLDELLLELGYRLDLKLRAVRLSNPLAGVDVDKPDDHELVEAILAGRA